MRSRIELGEFDRSTVERAREALAEAEAADVGHMDAIALCCLIGTLQARLALVLDVFDEGEDR